MMKSFLGNEKFGIKTFSTDHNDDKQSCSKGANYAEFVRCLGKLV
jgi:hypothetical protein